MVVRTKLGRGRWWRVAPLWGLLLAVTPAWAEDTNLELGGKLYRQYCGACHGLTGEGDGVVSGLMRPMPTNLTLLAKQKGGTFPFMETMNQTNGTTAIRAHGDPDMPVWGEVLKDALRSDGQIRADVQGRTMLIVKYIESLQKK